MVENLTIILLTFNEEKRIQKVLDSIKNITTNIFVVDSYSSDKTLEILNERNIKYLQHPFENYSIQRNWAQENEPFDNEWVMHLDADEPITKELEEWLLNRFNAEKKDVDGFMFSRKTYFLGRWIKHGGQYPNYHLRLYKKKLGKCEDKAYDQHFVLKNGSIKKIENADIYNTVADSIDDLILSHNRWATSEAKEIIANQKDVGEVEPNLFGNPIERKRWLKINIFQKSPLFLRSFMYFIYRYIVKLGFLDGKEGFIFYVLQSFWFRFLVDAKVFEMTLKLNQKENKTLKEVIKDHYGLDIDGANRS
jgi:glycosyltransferase involved in cell wall biosynthesis